MSPLDFPNFSTGISVQATAVEGASTPRPIMDSQDPEEPQPSRRRVMRDAEYMAVNRHLFELSSIHQSELEFTTGSVLAILQFPANPGTDCNGCTFKPEYRMRVDYDKLVATGSAKIQAMLGGKQQERIRRRHGLKQLPQGIDFVIDLTPPREGAERADLIAALWLPRGVKLWYLAGEYTPSSLVKNWSINEASRQRPLADQPVGSVLVLGHDDKCSCVRDYGSDRYAAWKSDDVSGIFIDPRQPRFRQIDDYCETRHCVNLLRLLRAINGADLLVNSATRMWTLVHIAVDLDITSVVRDSIAQWLLAPPNTKFIEIFPEEAFKVALTLQIPDALVTSFTILVNEFAMDRAADVSSPQRPSHTWAQRRRGDYGDIPLDPIEHGGIALYERIRDKLRNLLSENALDDFGIFEWDKLTGFDPLADADALSEHDRNTLHSLDIARRKLIKHVRAMFRDHVESALQPSPEPSSVLAHLIRAQRLHYIPEGEAKEMEALQRGLNSCQRALCPFFWENLNSDFKNLQHRTYLESSVSKLTYQYNLCVVGAEQAQLVSPYAPNPEGLFPSAISTRRFVLSTFLNDLSLRMKALSLGVLGSDLENESQGAPMLISDHIIRKLDENELKYLPIWAGGCDDGSGGVFQDVVPSTEMGPSEPGPSYHTGWTVATETDASTVTQAASVSDLGLHNLDITNAPRSLDAQDSHSAATRAGLGASTASEQFVISDGDFADAMFHAPADHQTIGQALVTYVNNGDDNSDLDDFNCDNSVSNDDEDVDMLLSDSDTISAGSAGGTASDFEMV